VFLRFCFSVLLRLPPSLLLSSLYARLPPPLLPAMCRAPPPRAAQSQATCRLSPVPPPPPEPRWLFPGVPRCPAVCPSRSSPPLAVAATRSAPPPAPCRSHVSLLGRLPPYLSPLPSSARATPTPPLPELRRGRHATHAVDP
jgi:hypothetical protein